MMESEERTLLVRQVSAGLTLHIRVVNPSLLRSRPPIVVVHGGPGLPHSYLLPLTRAIADRCIVFYDQIGCGRSSSPSRIGFYSIELSVQDLHELLESLHVERCCLFGHSFGGILCYEYLNSAAYSASLTEVVGIVLANTPTSILATKAEISRKLGDLIMEGVRNEDLDAAFKVRHSCSVADSAPLIEAESSKSKLPFWSGLDAIKGWEIRAKASDAGRSSLCKIPCLVLRGAADFVSQVNVEAWKLVFSNVQLVEINRSSHMPHIENEEGFKVSLTNFLTRIE